MLPGQEALVNATNYSFSLAARPQEQDSFAFLPELHDEPLRDFSAAGIKFLNLFPLFYRFPFHAFLHIYVRFEVAHLKITFPLFCLFKVFKGFIP